RKLVRRAESGVMGRAKREGASESLMHVAAVRANRLGAPLSARPVDGGILTLAPTIPTADHQCPTHRHDDRKSTGDRGRKWSRPVPTIDDRAGSRDREGNGEGEKGKVGR